MHKNQSILDDDVNLLRKLNGLRKDMVIYISSFSKYFFIMFQVTMIENDKYMFGQYYLPKREDKTVFNTVESYFLKFEYERIPVDIAKTKIPNVSTEFKKIGEATIFDCLFNDITSLNNEHVFKIVSINNGSSIINKYNK